MAGGNGSNRQGENSDKANQCLYHHHHLHPCLASKSPVSEGFKLRRRLEIKRISLQSINLLQENILRIFTESLHCDLTIINGCNVILTNLCIVKTRSPHFYEVLEPYFIYNNETVKCFLNIPGIFHHVESFVRLLYNNLDLLQEEQLLVELILNITYASQSIKPSGADDTSDLKKRSFKEILLTSLRRKSKKGSQDNSDDLKYNEENEENSVIDASPVSSGMADSGLETGSASPHETTISETFCTDLEELQATEDISPDEDSNKFTVKKCDDTKKCNKACSNSQSCDIIKNCNGLNSVKTLVESTLTECNNSNDFNVDATCSSTQREQQQLNSSGSSDENAQKLKDPAEEISQYETQVLNDPFYESECESEGNEQTNSFVPTESFEFINPVNISSINLDVEKESTKCEAFNKALGEKLNVNSEARSMTAEELHHELSRSNDLPIKKSCSSTSNYYFIDASTLNDEEDVVSMETMKSQCSGGRLPSYISNSIEYVPSRPNRSVMDDQSYKFTARKLSNLQSGHEKTAEFERELKLTEHLKPLAESRKVKRVDSTSDDKLNVEAGVEKEALVIEIKEADSGESAQASPCPDNSTNVDSVKDEISESTSNEETTFKAIDKSDVCNKEEQTTDKQDVECSSEAQRPPLIRRNTFELDSSEEKLSVLRQEYERRQGNLVFQHSIPQYSGHRVDGDSCFNPLVRSSLSSVDNVLLTDTSTNVQSSSVSRYSTSLYASQKEKLNNYLSEIDISKSDMICSIIKSASDKLGTSCNVKTDDESKNYSSSLPVTLSCSVERENSIVELTKRLKRDEATPIVSGGASTSDYSRPTDSPIVRRKTESTPIVSGGSVLMSEESVVKVKPTKISTSMTAWVVDMGNSNKADLNSLEINNSHANKESMSQSFSTSDCIKKNTKQSRAHEEHGSLGFFVNFNDTDASADFQKQENKVEQSVSGKQQYCEFFIDMSNTSDGAKKKKQDVIETNDKTQSLKEEVGDKKNIFSMFIDLSCSNVNTDNKINSSDKGLLAKSFDKRAEVERRQLEHGNLEEKSSGNEKDQCTREQRCLKEATKPSVFMFIESDSPVVRRRTLSSSRPSFKRHSWNIDKTQATNGNGHIVKESVFQKEHKRAHSLSVDRGDLRRLQTKTSNSSHSLSESAKADSLSLKNKKQPQDQESNPNMDTSVEDVFEFDMRDTPPNSHIEIVNEELRVCVKHRNYKELIANEIEEHVEIEDTKTFEEEFSEVSVWDRTGTDSMEGNTRKSETFDISSGSDPSSESNHDFELSEILNGEVQNLPNRSQIVLPTSHKISETHRSLNEKIKKIERELKSPECTGLKLTGCKNDVTVSQKDDKTNKHSAKENASDLTKATGSNFVRLSDLDKTPIRFHTSDTVTVKEDRVTYRMSNSIPETSWIESKLVMSRSSGPMRSLSRKLTSTMTTSLPPKQKSPLEDLAGDCEGEGIISESDPSSMQSSMGRSGAGSTEETETSSLAGKPYNRLGEDLLRMFLEEINPDVTIDVAGRRIQAHKCILSSRCQYFAAILSGGWIESVGNVISLQGYSYHAVHFALCHIYSGESNIPDSISIVELATLADMLCLEGLKEVIGYTLTVKYCHLFHKPCQICTVGVLECMPLAAAYGLDEVYRKSLRWITRHFVRIWPCKAFATLPRELMEKCYYQHIVHMSTDNVLQTMMDCDKLLATLPNVRWAEPVFKLVSNLLEMSVKFLSENFSGVLGNDKFQALGRELTWNISRLEDNFLAAADHLSPEQACKSYSKLHKMLAPTQIDDPLTNIMGQLFIDFLKKIQCHVEKCLIREAARAARTTTWLKMDLELRRRIQELACLVILPHETSNRQSRRSNFLKESKVSPSCSLVSRNLDLKRVRMAISEHTDKTLKQVTLTSQTKKVLNKPKTDPLERKIQEKQISSDTGSRPKSWPNKIEVKSRYLEPRNKSVTKETVSQPEKLIIQQRRKIMISSSDSSRTSSPAMKRAVDKRPLPKIKLPIKKDVKALSSDSLAESSVNRTNRKDLTSKSCGITRPESPSFKQKDAETGLSVDSLAEPKKKPVAKKKTGRMDTSMSTDSLMTEITATPKSNVSNKLSPTLNRDVSKSQVYERVKKMSPPMQQRSPLTIARRPLRSLESSTAASRNKAVILYQGSPNLRRNLLDAAKTPDIPSKSLQRSSRQTTSLSSTAVNVKKERREVLSNQPSLESPSKKSFPKSNGTYKSNSKSAVNSKKMHKGMDDKPSTKCHNGESTKQPTVGSRSGTFLKDEPTILKKGDTKSLQLNI